ncbi:MAG: amino acid ABC transporter ATP-binding protein [Candidatus Cloacimonadota bacterium]|nr:amino acid ABC transporter ATP-binding protein [Candidatus Cloacimonadota bacterium]
MIRVENLAKNYGKTPVLKNINININQGEVISIIGPSGSGKSILLRCLNLLELPSSGLIMVDGIDIMKNLQKINKLIQKMGMVFQSYNLFPHPTVLENLTISSIKLLNIPKTEAEKNALLLLQLVGLGKKINSYDDELSSGEQKQRVAIALCLSMNPEIILFDELASALDPTMISEVLTVMRNLAREGMTILVVTHEMDFACDVSNQVIYMDEGTIYEEGSTHQIFNNPQKNKTNRFINRIRSFHYQIDSPNYDLYSINAGIKKFCHKHALGDEIVNKTQLITEELIELYKSNYLEIKAELTLAYSEKNRELTLSFLYKGDKKNLLNSQEITNEIAIKIVKNYCKEISFSYSNRQNILELVLKK